MNYQIINRRTNILTSESTVNKLCEQFSISPLLSELLISRGYRSFGQIEEFINPKKEFLNSPLLFSQIEKTIVRIKEAIKRNEKICVFGDYDCDGICASAIIYTTLKSFGADVTYYLPDRFTDGYGMNIEAVKNICETGVTLIITVDNGISALKEIAFANEHGIDVIVTDHHEAPEKLPECFSIINPKLSCEIYPYKNLCGSGVALKLAQALTDNENIIRYAFVLASLGTVADIVPLNGENRIIVSEGLKIINSGKIVWLNTLLEKAAMSGSLLNAGKISFQIAPRLNAAGRLVSAEESLKLLLETDEAEIKKICSTLEENNTHRKEVENEIVELAENFIEKKHLKENEGIWLIVIPNAHEGVIGIAASKIVEKYNHPVIIACESGGCIKGSARSIPKVNIFEALSEASELFIKFGGHEQAAGFSISPEKMNLLEERLKNYSQKKNIKELLYKRYVYDYEAVPSQLTIKAVHELALLEPTGYGNSSPIMRLDDVVIRNARSSRNGEHLLCNVLYKGNIYNAVGFSLGYYAPLLENNNEVFGILFTPKIQSFRGNTDIQLELKNIFQTELKNNSEKYYKSLYEHFVLTENILPKYDPTPEKYSEISIEQAMDGIKSGIIAVYSFSMLERVCSYLKYKLKQYVINYSYLTEKCEDKVVVLVNPYSLEGFTGTVTVLITEKPIFDYYGSGIEKIDACFLQYEKDTPDISINRKMMVFVYKNLNMCDSFGNDINKFCDYLNNKSELKMNYFKVRVIMDALEEAGIISYEVINEKLYIEFKEISGSKDINSTTVMLKLNSMLL